VTTTDSTLRAFGGFFEEKGRAMFSDIVLVLVACCNLVFTMETSIPTLVEYSGPDDPTPYALL
jgi:hypothetical protein